MPAYCGLFMGILAVFTYEHTGSQEFIMLYTYVSLLALSSIIAIFLFALPALLLGLLIAIIKLKKGLLSYAFIFLLGGIGMYFWIYYIFGFESIAPPSYFSNIQPILLSSLPAKALVLGSFTSWIIAVFALPEKINVKPI